jgi:carbon monoxide dehydrogenase subunit G
MAAIDLRVFIRATQQRIWEIISDLEDQATWMVDVRKLEVTSEQKSGVGAVVEVTSALYGVPAVKDRMRITSWEPPHRFDVLHEGQFTGTGAFILEPVPGGTVFVWQEEFKPPLGVVGEAGFLLAVGPHLRKVFVRSMDNVRRLAEKSA